MLGTLGIVKGLLIKDNPQLYSNDNFKPGKLPLPTDMIYPITKTDDFVADEDGYISKGFITLEEPLFLQQNEISMEFDLKWKADNDRYAAFSVLGLLGTTGVMNLFSGNYHQLVLGCNSGSYTNTTGWNYIFTDASTTKISTFHFNLKITKELDSTNNMRISITNSTYTKDGSNTNLDTPFVTSNYALPESFWSEPFKLKIGGYGEQQGMNYKTFKIISGASISGNIFKYSV